MKKEEWINSVLESASKINEVDTNPFLFEKVLNRLNEKPSKVAVLKFNISWAAAIILFVALNLSTMIIYQTKNRKQNESAAIKELSIEINSNTAYNY